MVVHTDDEEENYHGQVLHARYLMTETWWKGAGAWKLAPVHVYAVLKDSAAIELPAANMAGYAGRYSGGDDLVYVIKGDGKQLTGGRQGRKPTSLRLEIRDVLFVTGLARVRKIFQRDKESKVTGFGDRREGEDLVWHREPRSSL